MSDRPAALGLPDYGRLYDLCKAADDAKAVYVSYLGRKVADLSPTERVDHDIFGQRALSALCTAQRAYEAALREAAQ